jgi:tungstate transport system ATP-binding protein
MKEQLVLHNLVVEGDRRTILHVQDFRLHRGNIYGIIGPSGAGKSTLLKVINLLIKPSHGVMHLFGQDIDLPTLSYVSGIAYQRQMAYVPQKPVMFDASVYANVAIGLRFHGVKRPEMNQRVNDALQLVGLSDSADQKATSLSGGEAQRIALARALVLKPKLLLLDEPTSNLDPINVSIFEQVLYNIYHHSQVTIIMVTHNLPQAKRVATHCIFIHQGQLWEMADTPSFFGKPQTKELAAFLSGQMVY